MTPDSESVLDRLSRLERAARDYRELVRASLVANSAEREKWYALLGKADAALDAALTTPSEQKEKT